ncbi:methionyl-tRNA formyltransferase [Merismopedia glauca]|uniref:Methionyl-tRNA formyltransferase n=1 Tax=Merismopedia glauca CCAP 1448/3 TaxID=1296344 RepID=A0A2T1BZJ4_9CYAN|nr:methionyl-tRNA formyltransferase [Merismopedia glauca]PSB01293.1 methionyl-tRNA formyltransferase [Merismopedia glauca CCAP 1448/3]
MKVIFFGTPEFAVPTLAKLIERSHFEVVGVVTQPDRRRGRGNQLIPSPVKTLALSHQISIWQPEKIKKDSETIQQLKAAEADVFVVVAYGQILSQEILDLPKLGCINVHGSLLPEYRGAAPIQWCIVQGSTKTGITTMLMDVGMDTGAMLLKAETPIGLLDNAEDIAQKLAHQGADLLIETLLKLEKQQIQAVPQDSSQATYAPLIKKADYALNWSRSALELHNQIRGFFPSCTATFRGEQLKIIASAPLNSDLWAALPESMGTPLKESIVSLEANLGTPGEIVALAKGLGLIVQTGQGYLWLKEVQLPGKRPQSGIDFANGNRISLQEVLGNGL